MSTIKELGHIGTKFRLLDWIKYPLKQCSSIHYCRDCIMKEPCRLYRDSVISHQDFAELMYNKACEEYIRLFGAEDIFELLL